MATKEKQKKGSFLSFYKSTFKTHKPTTPQSPAAAAAVVVVSPQKQSQGIESQGLQSNNKNLLLLQKLEDCERQIEHGGRRSVDRIGGGGGGGGGENYYVEARKSVSHVETNMATNLKSVISFLQVKVLVTDMPGFMQIHAFRCARTTYDSLEKFSSKHIAYNIKKEFDKVYGPAWHCIVGSNFGSYVTHSTGCFLYFSMEKLCILVFKTKVQKTRDSN